MTLKKLLSLTLIIFSLIIVSGCDVVWFEDLKTELDGNLSTEYRFYSHQEEEKENPSIEVCSWLIGTECTVSEFPVESFNSLIPGYHVFGWKYYRVSDGTEIKSESNINLNENGYVESVKVTPQGLDFYAKWAPNTDTKYTVHHYFQNIALTGYELDEKLTEELTGTTDTLTAAVAKEIPGFIPQEFEQKNINGDGSAVVNIYYNRKKVTVKLYYNDGRAGDGFDFEGYYGQTITGISIPDRSAEALVFDKWNVLYEDGKTDAVTSKSITYPTKDATYTLIWKLVPAEAKVTIIYPAAENDEDLDFHLEDPVVLSRLPLGGGIIFNIKCDDATGGFSIYKWIIDGDFVNAEIGQILDANVLLTYGYHSVLLVVTDNAGNQYSKEAIIQVKE